MSEDLATIAKELIDAEGRDVTLCLKPPPVDADKPWNGVRETVSEHAGATAGPFKGVFVARGASEMSKLIEAISSGGSPPRRGRESFLLSGLDLASVDLDEIDAVLDGGEEWRVTSYDEIRPGEVLYAVTLEVEQ